MGRRIKKRNSKTMNKQSALQQAWKELDEDLKAQCPDEIKVLGHTLRLKLEDYGQFVRIPEKDLANLVDMLQSMRQEIDYIKQENLELHGEISSLRDDLVTQTHTYRKAVEDAQRMGIERQRQQVARAKEQLVERQFQEQQEQYQKLQQEQYQERLIGIRRKDRW